MRERREARGGGPEIEVMVCVAVYLFETNRLIIINTFRTTKCKRAQQSDKIEKKYRELEPFFVCRVWN